MKKDWLVFTTGVVPAISSAVRKLTAVGENVLVQTPVYNIFFNSIRNNGRNVLENRLIYDGVDYRIDWEDLEKKLSEPQTTLMILCNPHNPTGMIWTREELGRIGALCATNHVRVISDEIHCDLTDPGHSYIPFASVSQECAQNSITCIAPTKAFNLAGLQTAAVAAFTKGDDWLDSLRAYLAENKKTVLGFLEAEIPNVVTVPSHATYLLWLDCRKIIGDASELCQYLKNETGLYFSAGIAYGGNGREFLRMNAACPRERLLDGLERLKQGIKSYENYVVESC